MMKKLLITILTLCLLIGCITPVFATSPRLVDDADLLSSQEAEKIEAKLDKLSSKYDMDIVIVTVASTGGKTPQDFADDYFDYNDYADDGILLLVSMEESDWYVSTTGYGIEVVTDAGLDYMSDRFVPYLSDEAYADAFETFIDLCDDFIAQADSGDPYDKHNLPKDPFRFGLNLLISLAVGFVVALIVTAIMKSKLKSVHMRPKADDYLTPGSLQLTRSQDLFLYTHLDRREKPKSSSGSSTHVSSSGTTHGGGGGKF